MNDLRLAHTCSTCKYGLFTKPKWWSHYRSWSSKKQLGTCLGLCDGMPPSVTKSPFLSVKFQYGEDRWQRASSLQDAAKAGYVVEREDYLKLVEEAWLARFDDAYARLSANLETAEEDWQKYHYSHFASAQEWQAECQKRLDDWLNKRDKYRASTMQMAENHYDSFLANYLWWQENWPRCRRCHRNCVCDLWVEEPKRESYARAIVNGGYTLNNSV